MESESERNKPVTVFMAFGTKGDVYPVAVSLSISISFPRKFDNFCFDLRKIRNSSKKNVRKSNYSI